MKSKFAFHILIETGFNACITSFLMNSTMLLDKTTNNHNDNTNTRTLRKKEAVTIVNSSYLNAYARLNWRVSIWLKRGLILMWRVCKHMHALSSLLLNKSRIKKIIIWHNKKKKTTTSSPTKTFNGNPWNWVVYLVRSQLLRKSMQLNWIEANA